MDRTIVDNHNFDQLDNVLVEYYLENTEDLPTFIQKIKNKTARSKGYIVYSDVQKIKEISHIKA